MFCSTWRRLLKSRCTSVPSCHRPLSDCESTPERPGLLQPEQGHRCLLRHGVILSRSRASSNAQKAVAVLAVLVALVGLVVLVVLTVRLLLLLLLLLLALQLQRRFLHIASSGCCCGRFVVAREGRSGSGSRGLGLGAQPCAGGCYAERTLWVKA